MTIKLKNEKRINEEKKNIYRYINLIKLEPKT
jgi:hypothetical protein